MNNQENNTRQLSGSINTKVEFSDSEGITIFTAKTEPNLTCVKCSVIDCRGKSPKDKPCTKFESSQ